jgi:hypothetical protein
MKTKNLTPVEFAIESFGGLRVMARAINRDPASVCRWKRHGTIPANVQKDVLKAAADIGLNLTPVDIIYGKVTYEE